MMGTKRFRIAAAAVVGVAIIWYISTRPSESEVAARFVWQALDSQQVTPEVDHYETAELEDEQEGPMTHITLFKITFYGREDAKGIIPAALRDYVHVRDDEAGQTTGFLCVRRILAYREIVPAEQCKSFAYSSTTPYR